MQPPLQSFLLSEELDELASLRDEITSIDRAEAAELSRVVSAWSDPQAIANLLMYPELIPEPDRLPSLMRGLATGANDYLALAAVVGLQRIDDDEIPTGARADIARQLVLLIEQSSIAPTPARATLTIGPFAQDLDPATLLRLLDHPDPAVRHNLLSALLDSFGVARVVATADGEVAAGRLSPEIAMLLRESLRQAGLDPASSDIDDEQVLESPLAVPLLSYVPNYRDWPPAVGQVPD
jgi:hypothetical protein